MIILKKLNLFKKKFMRGESGMALVELAFVAPFLMALSVGVVDFGLAWTRQMTLANAVRAGMQFALVHKPTQEETADVQAAVQASVPADFQGQVNVVFYCECPNGVAPCTQVCPDASSPEVLMSVGVSEDYDMIISIPSIGGTISLGDQRVVRLG